jgi:hypothetical protein
MSLLKMHPGPQARQLKKKFKEHTIQKTKNAWWGAGLLDMVAHVFNPSYTGR